MFFIDIKSEINATFYLLNKKMTLANFPSNCVGNKALSSILYIVLAPILTSKSERQPDSAHLILEQFVPQNVSSLWNLFLTQLKTTASAYTASICPYLNFYSK